MSVALTLAYGSLVGVSGTGMRRPRALTAVAARPVPDIADTVIMPPPAARLGDPTPDIRVAGDWLAWGALERALATAVYLALLALPGTGRHRQPRRYRGRHRAARPAVDPVNEAYDTLPADLPDQITAAERRRLAPNWADLIRMPDVPELRAPALESQAALVRPNVRPPVK